MVVVQKTMDKQENISWVSPNDKTESKMIPSTKRLFAEFNDQSTFHGVKYVFGTNNSLYRRVIWFLLFLTCASLVVVDVTDRIQHYMSHPVSLNLQINYNTTMEFPAVTICNQNAFRRTLSKEHGHFELIKELFEENENNSNSHTQNTSTLLMEDLFLMNGHKVEDLIVRCKWRGESCQWSNFTPILTKHGLCYTFKREPSAMIIDRPGLKNGLELVINAEEYDYMVGPHNSGGIKVVLHRPNEVPLPSEYGLEVPTGTHGFVEVDAYESTYLQNPYGTCVPGKLKFMTMYEYSVAACNVECEMSYVSSLCGCREIHMSKAMSSLPACTIEKYQQCVSKVQATFGKQSTNKETCTCPTPCYKFRYEPSLSYGSISQFSRNQISILRDEELMWRFIAARELAFREEMDYTTLKSMFELLHTKRLPQFYQVLEDLEKVDSNLSVSGTGAKLLKTCYEKVIKYFDSGHEVYAKYAAKISAFESGPFGIKPENVLELLSDVEGQIKVMVSTDSAERKQAYYNMLMTRLNMKIDSAQTILKKESYFLPWLQSQYPDIWITNINESESGVLPVIRRTTASILTNGIFSAVNESIKYLEMYKQTVKLSFNETYVNNTHLSYLNAGLAKLVTSFVLEKKKIEDFYSDNVLRNIKYLGSVLELPLQNLTTVLNDFDKKCTNMYLTKAIRSASVYLMSSDDLLAIYIKDTSQLSTNITNLFQSVEMKYFIEEVRTFTSGTVLNNELRMESVDCLEMVLNAYDYALSWYKAASPALVHFRETTALDATLNSTLMLEVAKSFKFDKKRWLEVVHLLEKITEILKDFKDSQKIDQKFYRNNFLHLNILYHELRYEEITQQIAYTLFSLLGDIGGAMGLFIGASVISIFELIDFLVIISRVMCTRKQQKKNVTTEKTQMK